LDKSGLGNNKVTTNREGGKGLTSGPESKKMRSEREEMERGIEVMGGCSSVSWKKKTTRRVSVL